MFELKKYTYKQEIKELIKKSTPIEVNDLALIRIESDISWGSFYFYFKDKERNENSINLTPYCSDVYLVLAFLWELRNISSPLILNIEDEGENGFFYAEKVSDTQIRFVVFNDYELYKYWVRERTASYSLADAHICLDIVMDKDKLIKQFYTKLWNEIKDWKYVEYEPWGNRIDKHCEQFIYKLNEFAEIEYRQTQKHDRIKTIIKMRLLILVGIAIFILGLMLYL